MNAPLPRSPRLSESDRDSPRSLDVRRLWLWTAASGTAILLLIFGGYEIIERLWLDADSDLVYALHLARGMGSAVILGTWAMFAAVRTRRHYDAKLSASIRRLEDEVTERNADLRRSQTLIVHQEKMASLGVLAAGIAHDIGNPLASLSSELELLELEDDPAQIKQSAAVLREHVERIGRALREMVDFARRRGEDELTDVMVATAIDDALRLVRHDKRMRNITLETHVDAELPHGAYRRRSLGARAGQPRAQLARRDE